MQRTLLLTVALCSAACAWTPRRTPSSRGPFCYAVQSDGRSGRAAMLPTGIAFHPAGDSGHAVWLAGPQPRVTDGARAVLRGWGTADIRVTLSTPHFGARLELRPSGRTLVGRGFAHGDVGPWTEDWVRVTATPRRCPR
ncbi:MAG TPA: hypothetical protein VFH27_06755 [Longimicrobiaceae bacterium]|nr:hypothetical protein [Longimicrobiaceae bacterium]